MAVTIDTGLFEEALNGVQQWLMAPVSETNSSISWGMLIAVFVVIVILARAASGHGR